MKPTKLSETDIQRTCSELLAWEGWRMLRTDPASDRARGKGFGELGMPDCLYVRYGFLGRSGNAVESQALAEVLWVEWKRPGGKAAAHQKAWHTAERARGALVVVAGEDFDGPDMIQAFREWYAASGLQRRK